MGLCKTTLQINRKKTLKSHRFEINQGYTSYNLPIEQHVFMQTQGSTVLLRSSTGALKDVAGEDPSFSHGEGISPTPWVLFDEMKEFDLPLL